jgi:hypothetical protein
MSLFLEVRVIMTGDVLVQASPSMISSILVRPCIFMLSPWPLMTSGPVCLIGEIKVLVVLLLIRPRVDASSQLHVRVHLIEVEDLLIRSLQ